MLKQRDPFFDLVDRDHGQENPAFAIHAPQPFEKRRRNRAFAGESIEITSVSSRTRSSSMSREGEALRSNSPPGNVLR